MFIAASVYNAIIDELRKENSLWYNKNHERFKHRPLPFFSFAAGALSGQKRAVVVYRPRER